MDHIVNYCSFCKPTVFPLGNVSTLGKLVFVFWGRLVFPASLLDLSPSDFWISAVMVMSVIMSSMWLFLLLSLRLWWAPDLNIPNKLGTLTVKIVMKVSPTSENWSRIWYSTMAGIVVLMEGHFYYSKVLFRIPWEQDM